MPEPLCYLGDGGRQFDPRFSRAETDPAKPCYHLLLLETIFFSPIY